MGHVDVSVLSCMSFLEVLLILITSCLIVGKKDLLDIRDKKNLLKLFVAAVLMMIAVVTVKTYIGQNETLLTLGLYILIWIAVYKMDWLEAIAGILIQSIAFICLEFVSIIIGSQVIGLHFNASTMDNRHFIYLNVITRLLDIILAIVIYKLPFIIIDIDSIKKDSNKDTLKNILPILGLEALYIFTILKTARLDYNVTSIWGVVSLVISIVAMLALNTVVLYIVIRLMRSIIEERKNKVVAYLNYQRLRKKYGDDIIAIDKEMNIALQKAVKDYRSKNIWGGKKHDK